MSYSKRAAEQAVTPKRKAQKTASNWANQALSPAEKKMAIVTIRKAYDRQKSLDLVDNLSFDSWRAPRLEAACGIISLRLVTRQHFRSIIAYFSELSGNTELAKKMWASTGRVKGSNEQHDTHENREIALLAIHRTLDRSAGTLTIEYAQKIASDQFSKTTLNELSAGQLQQLKFTLDARLSKKKFQ